MDFCRMCGKQITQAKTGRRRRYCRDVCKQTAFRLRRQNRSSVDRLGPWFDHLRTQGVDDRTLYQLRQIAVQFGIGAAIAAHSLGQEDRE